MDSTMEGLLETYLFETNSLLDGLDELLINAEKVEDFSEDERDFPQHAHNQGFLRNA